MTRTGGRSERRSSPGEGRRVLTAIRASPDVERSVEDRAHGLGEFVCPRCSDRYAIEDECSRCGVPVVHAERTLFARRSTVATAAASSSGVAMLVGIGCAVAADFAAFALLWGRSSGGTPSYGLGVGIVAGLTALAVLLTVGRTALHVGWRRFRSFRVRRRFAAVPLAEAVRGADVEARVRGRLRFDKDESARPRVSVVDERGAVRARLASDSAAAMYDRKDETTYACDGDLVECVGTPRACFEGGEGYRDRAVGLELVARSMLVVERKR